MAYRPIINAHTATSWGDARFGDPIPARFGWTDGSYHLTINGVTVPVPDADASQELFDSLDSCLTEAGYRWVQQNHPKLLA